MPLDSSRRLSSSALIAALLLSGLACSHGGGGGGQAASASGTGTSGTSGGLAMTAGAAAVEIQEPPGAPLGGFGATPRRRVDPVAIGLQLLAATGNCFNPNPSAPATFFSPSTGVLDPIYARAFILTTGAKKIALVKVDCIGSSKLMRDALVPIVGQLGVAPEDFILCATHTHSGPAAVSDQRMWQLIAMDCYSDLAFQPIVIAATTALMQADSNQRTAELGFGVTTETTANENRRGRPGICDPELTVIKVIDAVGKGPIAELFNYAVHGTCHGSDNMKFSSDCMGQMEHYIEGQMGGTAIFLNAAEGDVAPAHDAPTEGQIVGADVVGLWPSITTKPWVAIKTAYQIVQMPHPVYNTGCLPVPGTNKTICDYLPGISLYIPLDPGWLSASLPFQAMRIDDTVLAMVPGEPLTEIGWDIKSYGVSQGFTRTVIVGLANDHGSYFTTPSEYARALYEGQSTLYGPTTGLVVAASSKVMIDQVK